MEVQRKGGQETRQKVHRLGLASGSTVHSHQQISLTLQMPGPSCWPSG